MTAELPGACANSGSMEYNYRYILKTAIQAATAGVTGMQADRGFICAGRFAKIQDIK